MTRSRLALTVTAGAAGLALLTTACGGGSSTSSGTAKAQDPSVLTVASAIAPNSLNPALGGSADPQQYFFELAYDTLIRQAPNGTYTPALATKWGFVGSDSKTFDLTLRSGVKFNDGSALTADGVKKSLQYYANTTPRPAVHWRPTSPPSDRSTSSPRSSSGSTSRRPIRCCRSISPDRRPARSSAPWASPGQANSGPPRTAPDRT